MNEGIYYSASENTFFFESLRESYIAGNYWPDDLKPVDYASYQKFALEKPAEGKIRAADKNGLPQWADMPLPTAAQYRQMADNEKAQLMLAAQQAISVGQTKLLMGRTLTDDERARLNAWMDYIDALTATDTSTAPDISWPEKPAP